MATRSDRVTVTARSAISLPVPPQAFKWSFQDDEEIGIRDHSREIKRYCAGRRSSFDNWTPVCLCVLPRLVMPLPCVECVGPLSDKHTLRGQTTGLVSALLWSGRSGTSHDARAHDR